MADLGERPGPPAPPLFWLKKEEMTEGKMADRASKSIRSLQGYTYKCRGVQKYTWVHIQIQGCTGVYRGIHTNTVVYRSIHGYTYKYRGVQEYTWVYIGIQGFTGVYMGVHENTGVYRRGVYIGIQGYTLVNIAMYGMSYNPGDYMVGDYM